MEEETLADFVLTHALDDLRNGSPRAIFVFSDFPERIQMAPTILSEVRKVLPDTLPQTKGHYNISIDGTDIIFLTKVEMENSSLYRDEDKGVYLFYEG